MLDEQDIYICYRNIQSQILNKHYRHPKNWEKHFNEKLKPEQREALRKMKRYLVTTWSNVDLESYFKCGFDLYKTFSYHQFFNKQVINLYIQKDKNQKRKSDNIKEDLLNSAKYVKLEMKKLDITVLDRYCEIKNGFRYKIVDDYIKGKVSQHFIGYLIYIKLLPRTVLQDDQIQEIWQKWHTLRNEIIENISFLSIIRKGIENMAVKTDKKEKVLSDNEVEGDLLLGTETLEEKEKKQKEYEECELNES